jgi:glycosyltransferase involved in cell wall biosynthesis
VIVLSHPTGNAFVRALLKALIAEKQLALFATTIYVTGQEGWLNLVPKQVRLEALRRKFNVPRENVYTRPSREMIRLLAGRFGLKWLNRHESGFASVDSVYNNFDWAVGRRLKWEPQLAGVYCYEDGALSTFRAAKNRGLKCYYELPIAYWRTSERLLKEEAERWPAWKQTLPGVSDSLAKHQRKQQEIELADVVICPSQFVLDSIPNAISNYRKCVVAEFGSPIPERPPEFTAPGEKIRILFAGSMTQRKGLADVFAAMKLLKRRDVELVVLGSTLASMEFYRGEFSDFVYEAPRPHQKVLELMRTCDALILPSIVEGRALVQQEAMSQGLILLATANAGGQDLIVNGRTGLLLPIRSPEGIAKAISWLAENRAMIPEMKRAAFAKACEYTWDRYTDIILTQMKFAERSMVYRDARV